MKRSDWLLSLGCLAVGIVIAGVIAGAAWVTRGPDLEMLPTMADRSVAVADDRAIWVQKYEVTVAEWNACHAAGGCALSLVTRPDQQPAETPATGISHTDAMEYVAWINSVAGHDLRLPTTAEWLAIAKAVMPQKPDPIFTDPNLTWASAYLLDAQASRALRPRGSFAVTSEGVADLDGSVWEWTQDCYSGTTSTPAAKTCAAFFVAGEHVAAMFDLERDPARGGCAVGAPPAHLGMRLVSDHEPPAPDPVKAEARRPGQ